MRAAAALAVLAAVGGCTTDRCKAGTVFLAYTLTNGAEAADTIDVTLAVGTAAAQTRSVQRPGHATSGSIAVDFGSYPAGQSLAFTLTARAGAELLATADTTTTASPGCTAVSITLVGKAPDMDLGSDAAMNLAADLSTAGDLAPPDMVFVPGPSCAALASNCGAAGNVSCCDSPPIPAGSFKRSYDVGTDNMFPNQVFDATVSGFRLDKYEVTVGRFRAFVNAGQGTQTSPPANGVGARTLNGMASQGGWDASFNSSLTASTAALVAAVKCDATYGTWTDAAGANERRPINCVTWFEALAFCGWDNGFLPTEAEWNYAAAGGNEQRAYPWSNPPSSLTLDNTYAIYNCGGAACSGIANIGLVGSTSPKGDGRWGQSDLAGNMDEWVLDVYASPYGINPCVDCANLTIASYRVYRGGSWPSSIASNLRTPPRSDIGPASRLSSNGIRCARRQ